MLDVEDLLVFGASEGILTDVVVPDYFLLENTEEEGTSEYMTVTLYIFISTEQIKSFFFLF